MDGDDGERFPVWLTRAELDLLQAMMGRAFDLANLIRCAGLPELDRFRRLRDRLGAALKETQ